MQVLDTSPHIMYQTTHKGRALLLGGCPLTSLLVAPPLFPLHAVREEHMLLGVQTPFNLLVPPPYPPPLS